MSTRRFTGAALSLAFLLGPVAAIAAGSVYRCGNVYTDRPCPNATTVDVTDSPNEADQAAAREVASREAALAARMEADRQQAEAPPPAPRAVRAKRPAVAASGPTVLTRAEARRLDLNRADKLFVAVVPGSGRRGAKP